MMRLHLTMGGRPTVVLGLQPDNFRKLAEGDPIKVNLRDFDPDGPPTTLPDIDVIVADTATDDWRLFLESLGVETATGSETRAELTKLFHTREEMEIMLRLVQQAIDAQDPAGFAMLNSLRTMFAEALP